jgi:hypothetical protein
MNPQDEALMLALVDFVARIGSDDLTLRFSDDEQPVVWMAVGNWGGHHEVGAAMNPIGAMSRLIEQVVDGGSCTHCGRPTGFELDPGSMPLQSTVCWYQYDPELKTVRRGCEGDTPPRGPNRAERRRRDRG